MNKISKYLFVLCISAMFLSGCSAKKAIKLIKSGEAVIGDASDNVIPLVFEGHHILLKTKLNHSQKEYVFFLDTGAFTMISKDAAKELGLPEGVKIKASGTGGNSRTINIVKLDTVTVGGTEVKNCAVGVTDFYPLIPQRIAGILGSNYLKHFKVTIDYQRNELTLSHEMKPVRIQGKDLRIPFELDWQWGFAPFVECELDGALKVKGYIDTGLSGFISLPVSTVKQISSFNDGSVVKSKGGMSGGLFGGAESESYALRLNSVKIGSLQLKNVPSTSHAHKDGPILIGNKFLEKYLVILNYPAKEIILRPLDIPFESNIRTYGLGLTKQNQKSIVFGVWQNSVASKKGLKPGDEIVTINSIETSTIPSVFDLALILVDKKMNSIEIEFVNEKGRQTVILQKDNLLPILE